MKPILKQTSWLFLAQSATRIIGFFYTIFLARNLGVSDFGLYSAALAYFSLISAVADFGFNRFLIREIAKDDLKTSDLLWNIVMLRLVVSSLIFAIFAIIIYLLDPDKLRVSLTLVAATSILPQTVALTLDGIFVALQRLQLSAVAFFISSLATAIIGFLLITGGFGVFGAVNAIVFGFIAYLVAISLLTFKYHPVRLATIKLSIVKKALVGSLPYGLLGILGLIYFRIDTILLSYLRGNFETGIYGAAYRFLEGVTFIPSAFSSALFPLLAKLHDSKSLEMKSLYMKSLKIMGVLGFAIMLIFIFLLPEVIKLFIPKFLPSIEAIKILSLSIPLMFMAAPGVQVMFSTDKYLKTVLFLSIFTVGFNIILNLIFIPRFGFVAASWVTVLSDLLSLGIFYIFIRKKIFNK